jgi:hypothetical protein
MVGPEKPNDDPKGGLVPSMKRAFWRMDATAEPHGWVHASLDMGDHRIGS